VQVVLRKMKEEQGEEGNKRIFSHWNTSQMMKNFVRLSLYVWLVQVVMRKMKEEQGEEDNQRFLVDLKTSQMMENLVRLSLYGCRWCWERWRRSRGRRTTRGFWSFKGLAKWWWILLDCPLISGWCRWWWRRSRGRTTRGFWSFKRPAKGRRILLDCSFMSGWVQVVLRKMKEEQGEEDNESAAVGLKLWNSQSHVMQVILTFKWTMPRKYSKLLLKIKNSSTLYTVGLNILY
jgi:hypothetical protein